jgi:phospholipid/cholesterol/gamma-HCH transport system substrate-binding protein
MRFRIRYADQIVGLFILAAALALIFVIFMIGSRQRWFARDYLYKTYFDSAAGLSNNMAVLYKGFTIGNVKNFILTEDDQVEVTLSIYDTYAGRIREGSLVDLRISPIGLGNQFLLYPGLGNRPLEEGERIPSAHSPEGRELIRIGLALVPSYDDSITLLISRVNTLLDNLNRAVTRIDGALAGEAESSLGRILGTTEEALAGISGFSGDLSGALDSVLADIRPVLSNLAVLTDTLAAPEGGLRTVLDPQGAVIGGLESSLQALSGTLVNLEKTSAFLPAQLPQVAALLSELRETLKTAEDVLISLTNNPLLRKGIPERAENQSGGTSLRDISF